MRVGTMVGTLTGVRNMETMAFIVAMACDLGMGRSRNTPALCQLGYGHCVYVLCVSGCCQLYFATFSAAFLVSGYNRIHRIIVRYTGYTGYADTGNYRDLRNGASRRGGRNA